MTLRFNEESFGDVVAHFNVMYTCIKPSLNDNDGQSVLHVLAVSLCPWDGLGGTDHTCHSTPSVDHHHPSQSLHRSSTSSFQQSVVSCAAKNIYLHRRVAVDY